MSDSKETAEFFDMLAGVLLRCWICGFVLLYISIGVILLAGNFAYRLPGELFGLSKHDLDLILYCSIVVIKLLVLVLFFIPWLAVRLVLRGRKV